ncbi:MAG: uroporphyrinogen decarboxylase family protein [Armatimonadota bacterium]|nr:uroporphyrinogen decarboxylase family protein [Armatimonadota bacterium]
MDPRERIERTVNHELADHVPLKISPRDEVRRELLAHFQTDDWSEVLKALGVEGWAGVGVGISWPTWEAREDKEARPGDWPGSNQEYVWLDEVTFLDRWGAIQRVGAGGKYVEYIRAPLEDATIEDLQQYDFPGPDRLIDDPDLPDRVQELKDQGYWVGAGVEQPYKTSWRIRGMQQNLMDYRINKDFKNALYDRIYETWKEICRRVVSAGVDMFSIGGDIAMQDRLLMSVESWRELDKPRLADLIATGKHIDPDLHVFIHSDGSLMEIMDDLIEIGFDIINPIQPECMDPFQVKRRWGDLITMDGCGSIQQVLPFGTVEDVRKHVTDLIEGCAYNGGLILAPSNVVQHDTPLQNILAFYETAREYDLSRLA